MPERDKLEELWNGILPESSVDTAAAIQSATQAGSLDPDVQAATTVATQHALQRTVARVGDDDRRTLPQRVLDHEMDQAAAEGTDTTSYHLMGELARGGMGVIYRARQPILRREVAVKTLNPQLPESEGSKFVAEALITARLDHPNIVPVYDLTKTSDERMALAMKLVRGTNWRDLIKERPELEFHLGVLLHVADAVAFAHSRGVVHLDIKPDNVIVGEFGEVIVVDWGLALDYRDEPGDEAIAPPKSALKSPCGTVAYLAPELAEAEVENIGPRTDVYLLGATLFEVSTGRPPHLAPTPMKALINAVTGQTPKFEPADDVPVALQEVVLRACAIEPSDRYPSVVAFQDAVRGFLKHRQSLMICEKARGTLEDAKAFARQAGADRALVYAGYADAVAGFRQAHVLWPGNAEAHEGEHLARLAYADAALARDDLSVAETQAALAVEESEATRSADLDQTVAEAARIHLEVKRRKDALEQEARSNARLKTTIRVVVAILIGGGALASWLIYTQKQAADESRVLAEQRLSEVKRLSDVKHLEELEARAERLWPALPSQVAGMQAWLEEARAMLGRTAGHTETLKALRRRSGKQSDRTWRFADPAEQWQHDTQVALLSGLGRLEATLVPDLEKRLAFAKTVEERTITRQKGAWQRATDAIKISPRYGGLELRPQLGLVPLGPDPTTGLWEFLHIQTGASPVRAKKGWAVSDASGVVLVLLPGGTFRMGAQKPSDATPVGSPNVDPRALGGEGPVHEVTLAPFFIGKYELTQAQYRRVMGLNPAAYQPGKEVGGRVHSAIHPVEQVRWTEAFEAVRRMGLTLPTEAQWEYAARGGTTTVYATGDDPKSLQGNLNIADAYCKANGGPGSWRYAEFIDDGYVVHAPVGTYRANGFGLHDMAGNVWEWALDRFGAYTLGVNKGDGRRLAPKDAPRVFRGGGFRASTTHARSADRYLLYGKKYRAYDVGMRAARNLDR